MLELFENQDACAAGDHKTVSVDVIGARGDRGAVVEVGRHRAHRVEQIRHRPVQIFVAAGKDHVLLAPLDQLVAIADTMGGCRTGRRDRVVDTVDLEPGGECRRRGRRHALRHSEGTDALRAAVLARDVGGFHDHGGGRSAGAHHDSGAFVRYVGLLEARVGDRLVHRHVVPLSTLGQEAQRATVDERGRVQLGLAPYVAAEAVLGEGFREGDAGFRIAQRCLDLSCVVADGRHDPEASDDDPSHLKLLAVERWPSGRSCLFEQTDPEVGCAVYGLAICL